MCVTFIVVIIFISAPFGVGNSVPQIADHGVCIGPYILPLLFYDVCSGAEEWTLRYLRYIVNYVPYTHDIYVIPRLSDFRSPLSAVRATRITRTTRSLIVAQKCSFNDPHITTYLNRKIFLPHGIMLVFTSPFHIKPKTLWTLRN